MISMTRPCGVPCVVRISGSCNHPGRLKDLGQSHERGLVSGVNGRQGKYCMPLRLSGQPVTRLYKQGIDGLSRNRLPRSAGADWCRMRPALARWTAVPGREGVPVCRGLHGGRCRWCRGPRNAWRTLADHAGWTGSVPEPIITTCLPVRTRSHTTSQVSCAIASYLALLLVSPLLLLPSYYTRPVVSLPRC